MDATTKARSIHSTQLHLHFALFSLDVRAFCLSGPILGDSHQHCRRPTVLQRRVCPASIAFGKASFLPTALVDALGIDAALVKALDFKPSLDLVGCDRLYRLAHSRRRPERFIDILGGVTNTKPMRWSPISSRPLAVIRTRAFAIHSDRSCASTFPSCRPGTLLKADSRSYPVLYRRFSRLLEEIEISRADGSLPKLRLMLSKLRLLILDDWGIGTLTTRNRQDLLDVIDDCGGNCSIAITAQLPIKAWHDYLGEPTVADAILDRVVHSAHRVELQGESLRRTAARSNPPP